MTDKPSRVTCELSDGSVRRISELMPAVALWAEATEGEPLTGPADVVELAVAVLHCKVCNRTNEILGIDAENPLAPMGARH